MTKLTMKQINERLKDILSNSPKFKGKIVKDKDIAIALKMDPNNYAQLKFRNSPPYKEIMDFLVKEGISINLFFYGMEADNQTEYVTLRLFDINASLGGGAWNDEEKFESVKIDKRILEKSNVSQLYPLDLINGVGESMEPTILDGDLCFIAVGVEYTNGYIYAINTPDGVMLKEVHKQGDELMLISHNPLYLPIRYYIYECKIIGKFIGTIRHTKKV